MEKKRWLKMIDVGLVVSYAALGSVRKRCKGPALPFLLLGDESFSLFTWLPGERLGFDSLLQPATAPPCPVRNSALSELAFQWISGPVPPLLKSLPGYPSRLFVCFFLSFFCLFKAAPVA